MAYTNFAWVYDLLNGEADYDALHEHVCAALHSHGVFDGAVADLGCGTGELTLRLAEDGYRMFGVDASEEMLSMLREKMDEEGRNDVFLVHQKLQHMNLGAPVRAMVSSFDTLNHIGPKEQLAKAFVKAAEYLVQDGIFIFDMNTPYKHQNILADNTFVFDEEDVHCEWKNRYNAEKRRTKLLLLITEDGEEYTDGFYEYEYTRTEIEEMCNAAGLCIESVIDGETFAPLSETSQRYFFVAKKG